MKATNIRLGFATNSSSAHSVILGQGHYSPEIVSISRPGFEFGWESFRLTDAGEKLGYLAAAVYSSLELPKYQERAVLHELFKETPIVDELMKVYDDGSVWSSIYIDHQSAFNLPNPNSNNFPKVVQEAMEFFVDSRLVVHGGNDNDDSGSVGADINFSDHTPIRIRRDGDGYVIFNWNTGAKIRLGTIEKASKPELVDVKITDYCPFGCSFCYQSSTKEGDQGSVKNVNDVIAALGIKGLGVFEIAIGGGEPTACDHFEQTINYALDNYIKPNFTTFAVDWLLDEQKVAAANKCGGIGVSVHSVRDLKKVMKILNAVSGPQVIAQHVFGTLDLEETAKLIKDCQLTGIHLLLLGYKDVGFGTSQKPHDLSDICSKKHLPEYYLKNMRLSVDTAMVNNHPEFLEYIKANKVFVTHREGSHSMYVDAVKMNCGPSSYVSVNEMATIGGDNLPEQISEKFQEY